MDPSPLTDVILYLSNGRVGAIRPDGSDECYPEFTAPNQVHWQLIYVFPDRRQAVLFSQEPPRNPRAAFGDPDGAAFARTHLWRYDFVTGVMREIALPSYAGIIGLLPGGDRFLVLENSQNIARIYAVDLAGGKGEEYYTSAGYAYGTSLSPDESRVAFHITGAPGLGSYAICVVTLVDRACTVIASDPDWLYFGPTWSPDGQWVLYQRCAHREDPGHDRSDLCLSRADGSEHRLLTSGQAHWFAAAMGTPQRHGSGSNGPAWSPNGRIACTLLLPNARTAWPYRVGQPDLDHFNRDYRPELARGGTRVCLIDPMTGDTTAISHDDPPTWYVRPAWSPDGGRLAVARADIGAQPELWVMDADGAQPRLLTRGIGGLGADHCRWLQLTTAAAATLWQKSGSRG